MEKLNTSVPEPLERHLRSVIILSGDGQKQGRLDIAILAKGKKELVIDFIVKKTSIRCLELQVNQSIKLQSVMLELVLHIKKKTLIGKLNSLLKSTLPQDSFKISDLDSIGKDQGCSPFWNLFTKVLSERLLLVTRTDCADSGASSSSGCLKNIMSNSWFSTQIVTPTTQLENSQRIFWQSLLSLLQEITDLELEPIDENVVKRTKKIKLKPTKQQKRVLDQWYGISRWVYNKSVELYRNGTLKKNDKGILIPIKDHRALLINNCNFENENQWMLNYDYDLRDEALRTFRKNVISNLKKKKPFQMKFKSRKRDFKDSISVLQKKWNKTRGFYSNIFSPKHMMSTEELPDKLPTDTKLTKTILGEYTIGITENTNIIPKVKAQIEKVIFIDPGVKNFYTGYSMDMKEGKSEMITIGKGDIGRIARLLHHKHKLQSKEKKTTSKKQKKSFKKAFFRISKKIKNLIDELHKKITNYLTREYDAIYLPKLNFHNCRKLGKRSKEKLATFRHCALFDRIQMKTRENQTCRLYEVNEAYTSKTCCKCGSIDKDLGNKNIYNCKECNVNIERDYNGAINILLRYVTKFI